VKLRAANTGSAYLTEIDKSVAEALEFQRMREHPHLYVVLSSHGLTGCLRYEDSFLFYEDIVRVLYDRMQQFEKNYGKLPSLTIVNTACFPHSLSHALESLARERGKKFTSQLVSAAGDDELATPILLGKLKNAAQLKQDLEGGDGHAPLPYDPDTLSYLALSQLNWKKPDTMNRTIPEASVFHFWSSSGIPSEKKISTLLGSLPELVLRLSRVPGHPGSWALCSDFLMQVRYREAIKHFISIPASQFRQLLELAAKTNGEVGEKNNCLVELIRGSDESSMRNFARSVLGEPNESIRRDLTLQVCEARGMETPLPENLVPEMIATWNFINSPQNLSEDRKKETGGRVAIDFLGKLSAAGVRDAKYWWITARVASGEKSRELKSEVEELGSFKLAAQLYGQENQALLATCKRMIAPKVKANARYIDLYVDESGCGASLLPELEEIFGRERSPDDEDKVGALRAIMKYKKFDENLAVLIRKRYTLLQSRATEQDLREMEKISSAIADHPNWAPDLFSSFISPALLERNRNDKSVWYALADLKGDDLKKVRRQIFDHATLSRSSDNEGWINMLRNSGPPNKSEKAKSIQWIFSELKETSGWHNLRVLADLLADWASGETDYSNTSTDMALHAEAAEHRTIGLLLLGVVGKNTPENYRLLETSARSDARSDLARQYALEGLVRLSVRSGDKSEIERTSETIRALARSNVPVERYIAAQALSHFPGRIPEALTQTLEQLKADQYWAVSAAARSRG
jgi:hypothetical protein